MVSGCKVFAILSAAHSEADREVACTSTCLQVSATHYNTVFSNGRELDEAAALEEAPQMTGVGNSLNRPTGSDTMLSGRCLPLE